MKLSQTSKDEYIIPTKIAQEEIISHEQVLTYRGYLGNDDISIIEIGLFFFQNHPTYADSETIEQIISLSANPELTLGTIDFINKYLNFNNDIGVSIHFLQILCQFIQNPKFTYDSVTCISKIFSKVLPSLIPADLFQQISKFITDQFFSITSSALMKYFQEHSTKFNQLQFDLLTCFLFYANTLINNCIILPGLQQIYTTFLLLGSGENISLELATIQETVFYSIGKIASNFFEKEDGPSIVGSFLFPSQALMTYQEQFQEQISAFLIPKLKEDIDFQIQNSFSSISLRMLFLDSDKILAALITLEEISILNDQLALFCLTILQRYIVSQPDINNLTKKCLAHLCQILVNISTFPMETGMPISLISFTFQNPEGQMTQYSFMPLLLNLIDNSSIIIKGKIVDIISNLSNSSMTFQTLWESEYRTFFTFIAEMLSSSSITVLDSVFTCILNILMQLQLKKDSNEFEDYYNKLEEEGIYEVLETLESSPDQNIDESTIRAVRNILDSI